jgi:uncharacterized membrane protein
MTRLLLALPLLLAAGCATRSTPYAPVRDVAYQAMGWAPVFFLAIGDDRIVLRDGQGNERAWPRVLPRTVGGTRIWQSGAGAEAITVTARREECRGGGRTYRDRVTVRVPDAQLGGCGGPLLGDGGR